MSLQEIKGSAVYLSQEGTQICFF